MGCDIHTFPERRDGDAWVPVEMAYEPFDARSYGMFSFLAGVRNYSMVPPIAAPRGLPVDASPEVRTSFEDYWGPDGHTPSWLLVSELTSFDYDRPMEDRRYTEEVSPRHFNGAAIAAPGHGVMTTYREFLGEWFFEEVERLRSSGAERLVFWFDN